MTSFTAGWPSTTSRQAGRTMAAMKACGKRRRSSSKTGVERTTSPSRSSRITKIRAGESAGGSCSVIGNTTASGRRFLAFDVQQLASRVEHLIRLNEAHALVAEAAQCLLAGGAKEPAADGAPAGGRGAVSGFPAPPPHPPPPPP